jgi:hypothetical protein
VRTNSMSADKSKQLTQSILFSYIILVQYSTVIVHITLTKQQFQVYCTICLLVVDDLKTNNSKIIAIASLHDHKATISYLLYYIPMHDERMEDETDTEQ